MIAQYQWMKFKRRAKGFGFGDSGIGGLKFIWNLIFACLPVGRDIGI
jgi:hypothetical protein